MIVVLLLLVIVEALRGILEYKRWQETTSVSASRHASLEDSVHAGFRGLVDKLQQLEGKLHYSPIQVKHLPLASNEAINPNRVYL